MKKMLPLILSCLTMAGGSLDAFLCSSEPCEDPGYELSGDWLYWNIRNCDNDFATDKGASPVRGVYHIDPEYSHGFRVAGAYRCEDTLYQVRYTYYRADNDHDISLPTLSGTHVVDDYTNGLSQGSIARAKADWSLDLDLIELQGLMNMEISESLVARLFGGFKYARIDQDREILYGSNTAFSANINRVRFGSDMDAFGFGFGMGANYAIWECLHFGGHFGFDLMLGKLERSYRYDSSTDGGVNWTNAVLLDTECWKTLSVFHLDLGLSYDLCELCGSEWVVTVGYEFHHWINAGGWLVFQSESGEETLDRYTEDIGFDGAYVRLTASF